MRLVKGARKTVKNIAITAIGLRRTRANDFGENLIAYQSPRRHCFLDVPPKRGVGARHFAQNVTGRDLRVAVFLREQSRLCSLACARRADYHDNLRHRKLTRASRSGGLCGSTSAQSPAARSQEPIIMAHHELRLN